MKLKRPFDDALDALTYAIRPPDSKWFDEALDEMKEALAKSLEVKPEPKKPTFGDATITVNGRELKGMIVDDIMFDPTVVLESTIVSGGVEVRVGDLVEWTPTSVNRKHFARFISPGSRHKVQQIIQVGSDKPLLILEGAIRPTRPLPNPDSRNEWTPHQHEGHWAFPAVGFTKIKTKTAFMKALEGL